MILSVQLIYMHYKICIFFIALFVVVHPHIYSSTPKVTYNFDGKPQIYHLFLSLDTGLGADDYLKIIMPQAIHIAGKDELIVKLISFSNDLQVASTFFRPEPVTADPDYYVSFGHSLTREKWYEIQIYPTKNPVASPMKGLVQIEALSTYDSNPIIYDSNYAFTYINVDENIPVSKIGSLSIVASSTSLQKQRTASIYTLNIDITPTIAVATGGNFTLQIYYDVSVGTHASGTTLLDFQFMGLCRAINNGAGYTAVLNFCRISADLSKITFSMSAVTTQTIRISTQVSNPLYVSTRGIKGYWVDFISGKVYQNGKDPIALSVNPITMSAPATGRVYFLWGIDKGYTDTDITSVNVPLCIYKAEGSNIGPFNSFNVGFYVDQTSPINGKYRVTMSLGAAGILEGSIAHNLPAYSGLSVYCHYDTVNKAIKCENVGAFINTAASSYRYFISGKAYFDSSTIAQTTFGHVTIKPIVLNSLGAQYAVTLFSPLTLAETVDAKTSSQFLDTAGFHNTASRKIGNAKVVSFEDNGGLTSTGDAIKQFMTGTNSSVGVIPDLGKSQQLLFLMKVGSITATSVVSKQYRLRLLYNNKVIGFESGSDYETRGLDFVGYQTAASGWSISFAPCHQVGNIVCQKYNVITPDKNKQVRVGQSSTYNNYGMYQFMCGDAYAVAAPCIGDCSSQCNMFTGYGTSNKDSSVMAMRKVTFPNGYHSSIYADNNLLDFLFILHHGNSIAAISLINGYTVSGKKMDNIKASYVNYYHDGSTNYNKGKKLPMMVRVGGGVRPNEALGATVMAIFFDDNVKADTFYTTKGQAYDIGCSTNSCKYYQNQGITIPRNDIWLTNRGIFFYNIPPIQNQFNILAPVTPDSTSPPKYLTVAFFVQNHSIAQATNLLRTLSVFRLFGPVITGSIGGGMTTINGLAGNAGPGIEFDSNYNPGALTYSININDINLNPPNNTFGFGYTGVINYGNAYGAGVTITSFYYNIFSSSTLKFEQPPLSTAQTCTIFGYLYNQIQNPALNLDRNKKWVYTAFCPTDSTINLNSADGNIQFLNPQYPDVFTNGFPLSEVISYGVSNQIGSLVAFKMEAQDITAFTRSCSTSKLQPYNPYDVATTTGSGRQRATFTVITPQILMANDNGISGYPTFKVIIQLPQGAQSVVQSSLLMSASQCQISDPLLSCSPSSGTTLRTELDIQYQGTGVYTVTSFQLGLYAKALGSFNQNGTNKDYTLKIQLPQEMSVTKAIFGNTFLNSYKTQYCTCTSRFSVGITPSGKNMIFNSVTTQTSTILARTPVTFNFASDSYRETFFKTSAYIFNFGFLTQPFNSDLMKKNLRCMVYQTVSNSLILSTKWKSLSLVINTLNAVQLKSKQQIDNPKSIQFTMRCIGSGVSDETNTTSMSLQWDDNGDTVQQASAIPQITSYMSVPNAAPTISLTKRFVTQGFKSFYKFTIVPTVGLDQNSRIYFDFHMKMSSKLDSQGVVQCYTKLGADPVKFTYCQFINQRQLVIWNNQIVAASSNYQIQIFNVEQPKSGDIVPADQRIHIAIDINDNFTAGVDQIGNIGDLAPSSNSVKMITILGTNIDTIYIRSPQIITITFETIDSAFAAGNRLYLVLPSSYAEWISRGSTKTVTTQCSLFSDGGTVQLVSANCEFISKRILKIPVSADANTKFTLTVRGLTSPSSLPLGRNNQFRYKLFIADSSQQNIQYYSFADRSRHLSLSTNANLIDLTWKQFKVSQSDSLITLTQNVGGSNNIYVGYYSNVLELRQSLYPSNFKTSMQLVVSNQNANDFVTLNPATIQLGTSAGHIRMAANSTVAPGLYTLQFTKNGDPGNEYSAIPPLTLVVSNRKCSLVTESPFYNIPIGGTTLPILIKAIDCIPMQSITITPTYSIPGLAVHSDLSSLTLTKNTLDGKMYIVIRHISPSLTSASVVTVTLTITGPNAGSYNAIPPVTLTVLNPTSFQVIPSATSLSKPTLNNNTATFTMQCNMPSTIYWGIGIFPSILNSQALDFQARLISNGMGLVTNYTQSQDFYFRVYGVNHVPTPQTISKTLYGLKSNEDYIFKYFCVNQLGFFSDGQSINFTSLNYGAYLMKVSVTFRGLINYGQYKDLSCSLAENFNIPYRRVMTETMSWCQSTSLIFYKNNSSPISNVADTNGQYLYNFYILPDYSLALDNTNLNIRSNLALHSFTTTIITSTLNFAALPDFVQMQTEDIQIFTSPTITFGTPISGLNSVTVKGSITNMNGFIIIGIKVGTFNNATMTLPTVANMKNGIFERDIPLFKVKMQYVPQKFEVDIGVDELSANTEYVMFYYGTTDDPTLTADATDVNYVQFKTLEVLDININWDNQIAITLTCFLVLLSLI